MTDKKQTFAPEHIWLIDTGTETTWCDNPAPGINMDEKDAVKYIRVDCANKSDAHKETWAAAVNSTDRILKEAIRKGMDELSPDSFREWIAGFVK